MTPQTREEIYRKHTSANDGREETGVGREQITPASREMQQTTIDRSGHPGGDPASGGSMGEVRTCAGCHAPHDGTQGSTSNMALASPTNLSGQDVDLDDNGIVDLLENLCQIIPSACGAGSIFSAGFESGDTTAWNS